ncbi:MAG: hypothetical protein MK200_07980 [Nitrosopumilus sp.]|nr:hypothetical protein [Nitrosopumilus sp.]
MKIDEGREMAPFHLKKEGDNIKKVYSDHNALYLETKYIMKEISKHEGSQKMIMNEEGYRNFKKELDESKVSEVWDKDTSIKEKYTEWSSKVLGIKRKHEKRWKKKKQRSKAVRLMAQYIKILKRERGSNENEEKKLEIQNEITDLKKKIVEEEGSEKFRKMKKISEDICRKGKLDSGAFWQLHKRLKGKKENAHAVKNSDGIKVDTHEEIKEVYAKFYEMLLNHTNNSLEQKKEEDHVKKVSGKFEEIMEKGKEQKEKQVDSETIMTTIKKLKRKKAKDRHDWCNEMILEGGVEIVESLKKMVNGILKEEEIPTEWQKMMIVSINKKGGKETMDNKRGIFLTNIVSKFFEKVLEELTGEIKYDKFQHGGCKGRGVIDNWLIMMAVRDSDVRLKKNTYLFFGDLVKCFDRLWLKDCLLDLNTAGVRERELRLLYKLNEKADIAIKTPAGITI